MLGGFIAELTATNFISLWFAIGAAVAIVMAGFDIDWYWQVITFVLVSVMSLSFFYPLLYCCFFKKTRSLTNIDGFIGCKIKIVKINKPEDSNEISGYALIKDSLWAIKSLSSKPLHVNDLVVVKGVKGNILKVDFPKQANLNSPEVIVKKLAKS